LREHNWAANPAFIQELHQPGHEPAPLVLIAESAEGIVGGLLAETQLAWLRIGIMAVDPQCRGQGIGAVLLAEAERQAMTRGCRQAHWTPWPIRHRIFM
jgi:GNAT superfamily N-acetyltransferase